MCLPIFVAATSSGILAKDPVAAIFAAIRSRQAWVLAVHSP